MSVDIAWETFTAGPDGAALAEKIRDFMHSKFQTITLPRFIKAVHVHSFEFGSVSPEIEIKDICDPLPDFYEDDEDDGDEDDENHEEMEDSDDRRREKRTGNAQERNGEGDHVRRQDQHSSSHLRRSSIDRATFSSEVLSPAPELAVHESITHDSIQDRLSDYQHQHNRQGEPFSNAVIKSKTDKTNSIDNHGNSFLRNQALGIPGGTSNLSYFHLPVGGLSGAQTPLAAVASGTPFSSVPWQHDTRRFMPSQRDLGHGSNHKARPSTGDTIPSPDIGSPFDPSSPETYPVTYPSAEKVVDDLTLENLSISPTLRPDSTSPSDLQVVARVNYNGDVRMILTAEILLDYPMPSFVGIPLKLSVTGMRFDGVAILAYIKKRMHFCFLDSEDAQTLVGDQLIEEDATQIKGKGESKSSFAGPLREVYVESEIGKKEGGKQSLKNVGKVEKFVLEQVRRIFEEEFVFPSFWTFLV